MGLLHWFKKDNKIYPEFWQSYVSCFDSKRKENTEKRVVVFDMETTGLDFRTDVIMLIGAVGIVRNTISVKDSLELFMIQTVFKRETVSIHGILK
jgi:DNA polymerase-3 subunit epsilon